jgi:hypothetical protein
MHRRSSAKLRWGYVWTSAAIALALGCGGAGPSGGAPDVDADSAAAKALELYDANGDGSLDKDELAKCPPLSQVIAKYDTSGDGLVSAEEIAARLEQIAGANASFTTIDCTVTLNRRTLAGAVVKLRPVEFLADALPSAEGTTDDAGVAHPASTGDRMPPELAGEALVFPGLYHVEITHPRTKVPAADLGCEIDPSSRTGASFRFDLSGN